MFSGDIEKQNRPVMDLLIPSKFSVVLQVS